MGPWMSLPCGGDFEGHHGEGGAGGWGDVDDGEAVGEAGEGRADEGVGGLEQVVAVVGAARLAEVVHRRECRGKAAFSC